MKRSRFSEEQIIAILREHEAGVKTDEVCRKHGISSATFYKWKAKYWGHGYLGRPASEGAAGQARVASFMAWVPSRSWRSEPTPPQPIPPTSRHDQSAAIRSLARVPSRPCRT
jgi:transposase-like protein